MLSLSFFDSLFALARCERRLMMFVALLDALALVNPPLIVVKRADEGFVDIGLLFFPASSSSVAP